MDILQIDKLRNKLLFLFEYIDNLKDENRQLKQQLDSLETNLKQSRIVAGAGELKSKYKSLIEERDRLVMERELIRNKVKTMIERIETPENN